MVEPFQKKVENTPLVCSFSKFVGHLGKDDRAIRA